jgi:(4S)-4-hydroxy-5-phosphonooxypentane-2,3-dione isomerase
VTKSSADWLGERGHGVRMLGRGYALVNVVGFGEWQFKEEITVFVYHSRRMQIGGGDPMVVLAVTWVAHESKGDEVARLFQKLEAESRTEPGCLMYVVHRHRSDNLRFFIYEQYEDDAALEAHRNSPHFQRYAVHELPTMASRAQADLYVPLTGA